MSKTSNFFIKRYLSSEIFFICLRTFRENFINALEEACNLPKNSNTTAGNMQIILEKIAYENVQLHFSAQMNKVHDLLYDARKENQNPFLEILDEMWRDFLRDYEVKELISIYISDELTDYVNHLIEKNVLDENHNINEEKMTWKTA